MPDGTTQYQVTADGTYVGGGAFTLYLEATSNAFLNPIGASTGSFYAFVIAQTGSSGSCSSAQATLYKTVNGSVTQVASTAVGCSGSYMATITYQYDTLNRLIQASGTGDAQGAWSQTFTFDGFGNLTQKTGSNAPNNAFLATNAQTNQLTANGALYDANGNLTAYGTGSYAVTYAYDIENRLAASMPVGTSETLFGYDSANQRVYQGTYNTSSGAYSNETIYFYGADNRKLEALSLTSSGSTYTLTASIVNTWFAGQLLSPEDRLQSRGKYFPFGEDRTNPSPANPGNDQEKFATYTRDSATLLDYAFQRYYSSQLGRFQTPDPYAGAASAALPQSWNRYAYVQNDPINANDPGGLFLVAPIPDGGGGGGCFGDDEFDLDDGFGPIGGGSPGWGSLGPCIFLSPYFPSDPGVGVGAPPPPATPECFAQLKDRPVDNPVAAAARAVHTFWWVQASDGTTYVISGERRNSAEQPVTGFGSAYLDITVATGNANGSDTSDATTVWSSGLSAAICNAVAQMLAAAKAFPNGTIPYSGYPGPNSNTVAHYIATAGDLSPTHPFRAYGWNASLTSVTAPPKPAPPPAPPVVPAPPTLPTPVLPARPRRPSQPAS